MTEEQALTRAQQILDTSAPARLAHESACGLWLAYYQGNQWASTTPGSGGKRQLQQLRPIIDANRTDVRIALNLIRPQVSKAESKLAPTEIVTKVRPATRAANDQVSAIVGSRLMDQQLERIRGRHHLRRKEKCRCVLGSVVIRRSLAKRGAATIVRDAAGEPMRDRDGNDLTVHGIQQDWAVCPPYEFVRDPSAHSVDFTGEDAIGHEKPMPSYWVHQRFGRAKDLPDAEGSMGRLLEFQRFLYNASGACWDSGWADSEQKGYMFGEWWFRDDDADAADRWPWYLITVRDSYAASEENRKLHAVWFGSSPFHKLPLHHFVYDTEWNNPWGIGIPALTIAGQDFANIAGSTLLRQCVQHGPGKYMIPKGSVDEDKIPKMFSNRHDVPIVFNAQRGKPERVKPEQLDQGTVMLLQSAQGWMDTFLNQSPVSRGEAVKRGEAASAYQLRLEQADSVLENMSREDEGPINDLLTGTLIDIARNESTQVLHERLGHEFTVEQIDLLKNQDLEDSIAGVKVAPDSLRPRTQREIREDYDGALANHVLAPDTARHAMRERGVVYDPREQAAAEKQIAEIQKILSGEWVDPVMGQAHDVHMRELALFSETQAYDLLDQPIKDALAEHWALHFRAKGKEQLAEQQILAMAQNPAQSDGPAAQPDSMAPVGAV